MENYKGALNKSVVDILIRSGYFQSFGPIGKLLAVTKEFREGANKYSKTLVQASAEKRLAALREFEANAKDEQIPMEETLRFQIDHFGTPYTTYESERKAYAVLEVDDRYTVNVKMYSVSTGNVGQMKIKKDYYKRNKLNVGDVIDIGHWYKKPAYKRPGVTDIWLEEYKVRIS